jgi:uncharacterized protein YutE (UPF0331/DUF86 family)
VEFEFLDRLIESHRSLLARPEETTPSQVEISAVGAMLHSFYNGVENILKRIASEVDGSVPSGEAWHQDLLELSARSTDRRPAVITEETREVLREYLQFRHFFRNAYIFQLDWQRMAGLVSALQATLERFRAEVMAFLAQLG